MWAVSEGHHDTAKLLIERGADVKPVRILSRRPTAVALKARAAGSEA